MGWGLLFNRYTAALHVVAGIGFAVYRGVESIAESAKDAQAARDEASSLRAELGERDALLASQEALMRSLEADARAAEEAAARKTEELSRSNAVLAGRIEGYRREIAELSKPDQDCALRRVPDAVDRLLDGVWRGPSGEADTPAGPDRQ